MAETKKKTPSARVIAAKWLLNQLDGDVQAETLENSSLASLADTRVNDKKGESSRDQIGKIAGKFIERLEKIVCKFEAPPAGATKKAPPKKKKA